MVRSYYDVITACSVENFEMWLYEEPLLRIECLIYLHVRNKIGNHCNGFTVFRLDNFLFICIRNMPMPILGWFYKIFV